MATTQKPLAGDELVPYERENQLEEARCPECGQPPISTPNHEWCIRCARVIESHHQSQHEHPTGKPPDKRLRIETRFWEKVNWEGRGPNECWEWDSATVAGYGAFWVTGPDGGSNEYAHRVAYALSIGEIPGNVDAEVIRHQCHTRLCCNTRHLRPGTHQDNVDDDIRDGRLGRFDAETIREIRQRYADGDVYQYELAEEHGVDKSMISRIIRGVWYSHVPMPPYDEDD